MPQGNSKDAVFLICWIWLSVFIFVQTVYSASWRPWMFMFQKKKNSSSFVFAIQNPSSHPKALQWGDIGTWVSPILYKGKDERFWRLMSILAESGASVIQKGTRLYSAECLTRTNLHLEINEKNACLESNLIITFQPMSIYCCHPDTHLLSF